MFTYKYLNLSFFFFENKNLNENRWICKDKIIWKVKTTQDERLTTDRSMYVFWRLKVYTIALARTI